jgi:hypothetical protein
MFLPKDLNRLILQFVESPRIGDLMYQCWKDQLQYNQGYFCSKTKYHIQPSGPCGRSTFAGGWTSHMVFTIIRNTFSNDDVMYKYEIEVVWNMNGDALSVFSMEPEEEYTIFPIDFTVLGSMPRACTDAPEYFVGHVWEIEVDTSMFRSKKTLDHEHLYHGGYSFAAAEMLELLETLTPEDMLVL